jgi:chromate transporter
MTDQNAENITDCNVPFLTLPALFFKFLRFGMLAFGGPVAQIAMLKQVLIEREHWISPARFNRLLAVMQVLPGPEAHELCVHLGMIARGRCGGLLAGLGFMLPGLLLMLAAGWLYTIWVARLAGLSSILLGVQIVVLAIILRAVVRIGQHIITSRLLAVIAVACTLATLMNVPFWIPLAAGGLVCALAHRRVIAGSVALAAVATAIILQFALPTNATIMTIASAPVTLAALFLAGLKGGLLTFGGAYTAIPYVRNDTVGRGWLSDATFLDGIALAGLLPAPLVIFATFVGYVVGGLGGALAITAGMFLPAFAFSLVLFERLETLIENPALHRLLEGVAAAVVGIILATFLQLGTATSARIANIPLSVLLFAAALIVAWRVKGPWVTPMLVAGGALSGWLITAIP